jgi:hypothetical protein
MKPTNPNFRKILIKGWVVFSGLAFVLLLAACSGALGTNPAVLASISTQAAMAVESTRQAQIANDQGTQSAATQVALLTPSATNTLEPSATPSITPTGTASPTLEPSATATSTETATPTQAPWGYIPEDAIVFYLTSLGTGGPVGCGDSLVRLTTGHVRSGDLAADLKVALDAIFSAGQYVGSLYNATYPSSLKVGGVDFNSATGIASVQLAGSYVVPESSCDASRYRAQVWATALQFKEITRFIPSVGNSLLGDRLAIYSDGK